MLLDPESWSDKTDSKILLAYKSRHGFEKLFALCFAECSETIHHWNTFADGISGCCIKFDTAELKKCLSKLNGVRCESVDYKTLDGIASIWWRGDV